jgi:hypothetical protein
MPLKRRDIRHFTARNNWCYYNVRAEEYQASRWDNESWIKRFRQKCS